MDLLTVMIVLSLIGAAVALIRFKGRSHPMSSEVGFSFSYLKKQNLFSISERIFYRALKSAVGHQFEIYGQVRVADLLDIKKGLPKSEWQAQFNRIKCKYIDFVLCDPIDLKVICAIELDDKSQEQSKGMQQESFLNSAFEAAGLPLLHFKARHEYHDQEIIAVLEPLVGLTIRAAEMAEEIEMLELKHGASQRADEVASRVAVDKKSCPQCRADMLRKKVARGESFWCCSHYPSCTAVMPLADEAAL